MCITSADVRLSSECTPLVAAVALVERTSETKKTLHVRSPHGRAGDEVRIGVDQAPHIQRPFERCDAKACTAGYEAGPEQIAQLKRGQRLVLEAIGDDNSPIRLTLPLAGFAQACDGPPSPPKVFEQKGLAGGTGTPRTPPILHRFKTFLGAESTRKPNAPHMLNAERGRGEAANHALPIGPVKPPRRAS